MKSKFSPDKKRNIIKLGYSYLEHYFKGNTRHGIHSPFLYNLLSNCIYFNIPSKEFEDIEKQRKRLKSTKETIKVSDLGSQKSKKSYGEDFRSISGIAKSSLKNRKHAILLHKIAHYFECDNILELGTSFGITTSYLSKARPHANIDTLEGCPQIASEAQQVFKSLNLKNITLHTGNIDELLQQVIDKIKAPDLVFIDANHTYQATMKYFNILLKYKKENTILIIDDIHWSPGMEKAWREICSCPEVTVTIDLFFMGVVFFKKGLSKENFVIRY